MKRYGFAVLFLISAMLFGTLISCADNSRLDGTATTASEIIETAEEMTKYDYANQIFGALPAIDFEGEDFVIAARTAVGTSEKEIWVREMDGDVINDAIYARNLTVNERFNCTITLNTGDVVSITKQAVTAGDDTYKLVYPSIIDGASLAQQAFLLNYLDFEHVNIYEQWWDQGTAALEISGKVYFMNGDINILDNDVTYILMFNKKIITDVGLDEPYQLVRDGKWVIDVFTSMIKDVTTDLDGDGSFTDNDMYGYVTTGAGPNTFFYASGITFISFDSDGTPVLDVNTTKITSLLEKVVDIFHNDNTTRVPGSVEVGRDMFMEDRVLFYGEVLSYIINIRAMETAFGVLPLPKYDEMQANYYTHCEGNASTVGVPMMLTDPVSVSVVLEAMALQSFLKITPAYYDTALQRKYTRDDESSEMLDIALAYRIYDIGKLFNNLGLSAIFNNLGIKGSTDFASSYAKAERTAAKNLEKIVNAFAEQDY